MKHYGIKQFHKWEKSKVRLSQTYARREIEISRQE